MENLKEYPKVLGKINLEEDAMVNNIHKDAILVSVDERFVEQRTAIIMTPRTINLNLSPEEMGSSFGIQQIISSLLWFLTGSKGDRVIRGEVQDLLYFLTMFTNYHKVTLDFYQAQLVVRAIKAKMEHCEKEREAGSEFFNIDTYIGLKLMLLQIKESMIMEVIEFKDSIEA